jgi:hypothetical protein
MNSPFLDAARWDAEVAKMIKAFGAPNRSGGRQDHRGLSQTELRGVSCFQYKMKCERSANAEGRLLGMAIISG